MEVLVINRAEGTEIAQLAGGQSVSSVVTPTAGELAVYYDFEGESGQTATDRFTADGAQNGVFVLESGIDNTPADARLGDGSAMFDLPEVAMSPFSLITTDITGTDLGTEFTMSAVVNVPGGGHAGGGLTRLFSTFSGTGNAAGTLSIRFQPARHRWQLWDADHSPRRHEPDAPRYVLRSTRITRSLQRMQMAY